MNSQNIRLSRIAYPRGTFWAMLLLVAVFLGFGVVAEACLPDANAAAPALTPELQPQYAVGR